MLSLSKFASSNVVKLSYKKNLIKQRFLSIFYKKINNIKYQGIQLMLQIKNIIVLHYKNLSLFSAKYSAICSNKIYSLCKF